jgi:hypothetical protein
MTDGNEKAAARRGNAAHQDRPRLAVALPSGATQCLVISLRGRTHQSGAKPGGSLSTLLELLGDATRLYRLAGSAARKVLNQVFFTRIYIDATDGVPFVASDDPTDVIRPLVEIQRNAHGVSAGTGQHNGGTDQVDGTAVKITPTVLLTTALAGGSSSKTAMVEPRGLEPLTFCLPEL